LNKYFPLENAPDVASIEATPFHPDSDAMYRNQIAVPDWHPLQHGLMQSFLPENHPNVDTQLQDPKKHPLPKWHPSLNDFVFMPPSASVAVPVTFYHPDLTQAYEVDKEPISRTHPSVQVFLSESLPDDHPDVDELLRNPAENPLPVRVQIQDLSREIRSLLSSVCPLCQLSTTAVYLRGLAQHGKRMNTSTSCAKALQKNAANVK
jgi:hypothetical protein